MGMKAEVLMTLEKMLLVVLEDPSSGDPGRDLHDCEVDDYALADGTLTFDDHSGASSSRS